MSQYCDSQKLEEYWYQWILSDSVPELERFRELGWLYTKVIGYATHEGKVLLKRGKPLPDPSYPVRRHCLPFNQPLFFCTIGGELPKVATATNCDLLRPCARNLRRFQPQKWVDKPLASPDFLDDLVGIGYIKEPTKIESWHSMLENIKNICGGISMKFRLDEDEQSDLASDALLQVTNKLVSGKLVYMPGRAPVFNLLTTTTYRIMYSILNKKNSQRNGQRKLVEDAAAGVLPTVGRSIRVPNIKT